MNFSSKQGREMMRRGDVDRVTTDSLKKQGWKFVMIKYAQFGIQN